MKASLAGERSVLGSIERAIEAGSLLEAGQVAQILGIGNPEWVERQGRSGALPRVKLGHYVRFDPFDLPAFIESMKQ